MLRDKNLIPLSHQHQHGLALCVRIERALRAGRADPDACQQEIEQHFDQEIRIHFAAEEEVLFPAARNCTGLESLVQDLCEDHRRLREMFQRATEKQMTVADLQDFAQLLSTHIRKEERQLFEALQKLIGAEELTALGSRLAEKLEGGQPACILPRNEAANS